MARKNIITKAETYKIFACKSDYTEEVLLEGTREQIEMAFGWLAIALALRESHKEDGCFKRSDKDTITTSVDADGVWNYRYGIE